SPDEAPSLDRGSEIRTETPAAATTARPPTARAAAGHPHRRTRRRAKGNSLSSFEQVICEVREPPLIPPNHNLFSNRVDLSNPLGGPRGDPGRGDPSLDRVEQRQ